MEGAYIEAILVLGPAGDRARVERWLGERGLQALPMRAGMLVSGGRPAFEAAFGALPDPLERPLELALPDELADAVASLTIPPLPTPGGG